MSHLLIDERAAAMLAACTLDPPHALLLVGAEGVGKLTMALDWASQLSATALTIVSPDEKGTISIATIRNLYQHTRTRQHGRQVIVIDHAEAMGIEAQNAFLKLLEEPREGVVFILTAPSLDAMLATITSRTQHIMVPRVAATLMQQWLARYAPDLPAANQSKMLFIADGRPGVLARLMANEALFVRYCELMHIAKALLTATPYERLRQLSLLVKQKDDLLFTLEAMAHMVKLQLQREAQPQLLRLADGLELCLSAIAQNGNLRAQATHLFMTF